MENKTAPSPKTLFEQIGVTYTDGADGLLYPDIVLNEDTPRYGKYGRMRKAFLNDHSPATYSCLILQCKLVAHLNEIDDDANEQMENMMDAMAKAEGVTEVLKATNQMEWVRRMNSMAYKILYNEGGISKQRDILNELETSLMAYNLSRDASKKLYGKKNRLIKERNALSPLQILRRKELTDEINRATAELQRYSEDQHELLQQMGCQTRKDISLVEERIEKLKGYVSHGNDVNAGFKAQIDDGTERFRKKKVTSPPNSWEKSGRNAAI